MTARRKDEPAPFEVRQFDLPAIELGIRKLNRRIEQVRALEPNKIMFDDQQVDSTERDIGVTVLEIFGPQSVEYDMARYYKIWYGDYNTGDDEGSRQQKFAAGIPQAIKMLEGLIARLEEKREDIGLTSQTPTARTASRSASRRVFLVHGKDEALNVTVAR